MRPATCITLSTITIHISTALALIPVVIIELVIVLLTVAVRVVTGEVLGIQTELTTFCCGKPAEEGRTGESEREQKQKIISLY